MILLYSSISPKTFHYSSSYWFMFDILKYISWTNFRTLLNDITPSKNFIDISIVLIFSLLLLTCWSHLQLLNPMDCSMSGSPVLHYIPQFAESSVHWVSDAIQSSHSLLPSSLFALSLSQHQDIFQWDSSLHQVVKVFWGSASVFPMNILGWIPLRLAGLISLLSKGPQTHN